MDFMDLIDETAAPEPTQRNQGPNSKTAVQPHDPMDPGPVIALFDKFHGEISKMADVSAVVEVTDQGSNETALELTLQCKNLVATLEKQRQKAKEPYLVVTRLLDGEVKALRDRLGDIQQGLNGKIRSFMQQEEAKRQELQRQADEQRRREQARIDADHRREQERLAQIAREKATAEAKARGESDAKARAEAEAAALEAAIQAPPIPMVVMPKTETAAIIETGTARLKTKTTWKMTNFKALPDALFSARGQMIKKAIAPWVNAQIKAGVLTIPGVEIYEEQLLETRNRR